MLNGRKSYFLFPCVDVFAYSQFISVHVFSAYSYSLNFELGSAACIFLHMLVNFKRQTSDVFLTVISLCNRMKDASYFPSRFYADQLQVMRLLHCKYANISSLMNTITCPSARRPCTATATAQLVFLNWPRVKLSDGTWGPVGSWLSEALKH